MNLLDVLIVVAMLLSLGGGFRRGFWLSLAQYTGALVGLIVGVRLAADVVEWFGISDPLARQFAAVMVLVVASGIGGSIGFWIGGPLRRWLVRRQVLGALDSVLGALLSAGVTLVVIWLLALTFARGPVPVLAQAIQRSTILRQLDETVPVPPSFIARVQQIASGSFLPPVFVGLEPNLPSTTAPSPSSAATEGVRTAAQSTVKIQGQGCGGISTGSGFVVRDGLVVTNAHVVSGTGGTTVIAPNGRSTSATAVYVDSDLDLAILRAPGLSLPPLQPDEADAGERGAVIGYPGGGPERISPAVIAGQFTTRGRDIYSKKLITRDILTVTATVRPGNSGGPVVDESGRYVGAIFAASVSNPGQAYAIPVDSIIPAIAEAASAQRAVETRSLPCVR